MKNHLDQIGNWPERAKAAKYGGKELACLCGVSLRTLQRFFVWKKWGHPQTWQNELRLKAAPALLQAGLAVKEVANATGYNQSSQFSRKYKEFYGMSPSQVQKPFDSRLSPCDMLLSPPGTPSKYTRPRVAAYMAACKTRKANITEEAEPCRLQARTSGIRTKPSGLALGRR